MDEWTINNWVKGDNQRSKIWAILPVDSRAVLPRIDDAGRWEEFRRIAAERFADFEEARQAIEQDGFCFTQESVAIGPLTRR